MLFAQVLEPGLDLAAGLAHHVFRDADAAGIGQSFQSGCHVDAVAIEIVALDHYVAKIDADAQFKTVVRCHPGISVLQRRLNLDGTGYSIDDAAEFDKRAVAHQFDDTSVVA